MVGFLPIVREKMTLASQPRVRPPLAICPNPKELRRTEVYSSTTSVLLEIANGPPRLRADLALYQNERKRFLPALEPLPAWLFEGLSWSTESRLNQALEWRALQMVKPIVDGSNMRIQLAASGHEWLSGDLVEQYARVFNFWTRDPGRAKVLLSEREFYDPGGDLSRHPAAVILRFFGEQFTVHKVEKRGTPPRNWSSAKPAEQLSLPPFFERALTVLKPGVFYRLDSVVSHLSFREHNPLNAGLSPDRTVSLGPLARCLHSPRSVRRPASG